jgi:GNAT superfamily N-acetyltransferase
MRIERVRTPADMRRFVRLPQQLFGKEPGYVPPLWLDERQGYRAKNNPILANSDFELLLLLDDAERPAGRVIAYVDHTFNRFYQSKIGFFGSFDCIADPVAGRLLIQAAEDWLRGRGMVAVRGPINPVAECWGFVWEGYERPPVYLSPWNPPYYHDFFREAGYEKAKDLLVYEADIQQGYRLPERFAGFAGRFHERFPGVTVRRLDMKRLKEDAHAIWEISNVALAGNWGYVPLELPVLEDMLRKLKIIVDPDAVWIAEDEGRPVGFCLGFPDINIILKRIGGHLLPFGWIHLLFGVKKLRDYRLFGLAVHPDWQGRALDALMYINLYDKLAGKRIRMEANYILEDNYRIRNALEKLAMRRIKTYRIVEKRIG